jgi:hypothetical protein
MNSAGRGMLSPPRRVCLHHGGCAERGVSGRVVGNGERHLVLGDVAGVAVAAQPGRAPRLSRTNRGMHADREAVLGELLRQVDRQVDCGLDRSLFFGDLTLQLPLCHAVRHVALVAIRSHEVVDECHFAPGDEEAEEEDECGAADDSQRLFHVHSRLVEANEW